MDLQIPEALQGQAVVKCNDFGVAMDACSHMYGSLPTFTEPSGVTNNQHDLVGPQGLTVYLLSLGIPGINADSLISRSQKRRVTSSAPLACDYPGVKLHCKKTEQKKLHKKSGNFLIKENQL